MADSLMKFEPKDDKIISECLWPKIHGHDMSGGKIREERIYSLLPSALDWNPVPTLEDHTRYYYVRNIRASKTGSGKRAKRTLEDNPGDDVSSVGFWRASNKKEICQGQNNMIGFKRLLNFFLYTDQSRNRTTAVKSRWLMYEYFLPSDQFQEWVVCKIKDKEIEKKETKQQLRIQPQPQPHPENYYNYNIQPVHQSECESLTFYEDGTGELFVDLQPPPPSDHQVSAPQHPEEGEDDWNDFANNLAEVLLTEDILQPPPPSDHQVSAPQQPEEDEDDWNDSANNLAQVLLTEDILQPPPPSDHQVTAPQQPEEDEDDWNDFANNLAQDLLTEDPGVLFPFP